MMNFHTNSDNELLNSLLTLVLEMYYCAGKHRFGLGYRCKDDNVLAALQLLEEKFVCRRMRFWRF